MSAFQVNAIPVAGDFAPDHPGDEIGLFDGKSWYLDTVGDNQLHTKIASNMPGNPIVRIQERGIAVRGHPTLIPTAMRRVGGLTRGLTERGGSNIGDKCS